MSHIFISYSRKDIEIAGKIVQALAASNLDTWIDWKSIPKGEDWEVEIYRGIEEADAFLFLISPDSVLSEMCSKEVTHAVRNGKRILPIVVRETHTKSVHPEISRRNWIFCLEKQDNFTIVIDEIQKTIHTDYEWLRFHTELQVKALKWAQKNDVSRLLRGRELQDAEEKLAKAGIDKDPQPTELQRAYLLSSQRHEARQRRQITMGLGLGLVLVTLLALLAWNQRTNAINSAATAEAEEHAKSTALVNEQNARGAAQAASTLAVANAVEAQKQAQTSLARQVAAQAISIAPDQLDLGLLLSNQAYNIEDTFESRSSLFESLETNPQLDTYLHGHPADAVVNCVAISPDSMMFASGDSYGLIVLWDMKTRSTAGAPLTKHSSAINSLEFSPDGKTLASSDENGVVFVWDVSTRKVLWSPPSEEHSSSSRVAFSPDGKFLATNSDDTVHIWDLHVQSLVGNPVEVPDSSINSIAFNPNGTTLAIGSNDGSIVLWDLAAGKQLRSTLLGHKEDPRRGIYAGVTSLDFSADGKLLASGSADQSIILWDAFTGQKIRSLNGHSNAVWDVVFSPDGKTLASAGADLTIRLWQTESGEPIGQPLKGHSGSVLSVAFSSDNQTLISGGRNGEVLLWNLSSTNRLIHSLSIPGGAWAVSYSPDGTVFASAGSLGDIIIWDATTHKKLGEPLLAHQYQVSEIAFSPDGSSLVSIDSMGFIKLWNLKSRKLIAEPTIGTYTQLKQVAFSPDGKTVAVSVGKEIYLWDTTTGQIADQTLSSHTDTIIDIAFNGDGGLLLSGGADNNLILWDINLRKPVGQPLSHASPIRGVAIRKDGGQIAAATADGSVILWDLSERKVSSRKLTGHTAPANRVAFSPNGKILASTSRDRTILLWDAETGEQIGDPLSGHRNSISSVSFSPNGRTLLSSGPSDGIYFWELTNRRQIGLPLPGHVTPIFSTAFTSDDRALVTGMYDGTIRIWDMATGRPISSMYSQGNTIWGVAVSPDGKTLATGSADFTIQLWDISDLAAPRPIGTPLRKHSNIVISVKFSPNGELLASSSSDGSIILWDVTDLQAPKVVGQPLAGHIGEVYAIAFSPDGKLLASGGRDGKVILWDVITGQKISAPLSGHDDIVRQVAFSPDGRFLISAGVDKKILIWDVEGHHLLGEPLLFHQVAITGLAFNPDGKSFASSSVDGVVVIWDLETRRPLGSALALHASQALGFGYSSDGKTLVSAGNDGTAVFLDTSWESWRKQSCELAHRELTRTEWDRYLQARPYEQTCPDLAVDTYSVGQALNRLDALSLSGDRSQAALIYKNLMPWVQQSENLVLYDRFCYLGSLDGAAATVMPLCQRSVELSEPKWKANFLHNRGMARAMLGNYSGAAEDLKAFIEWTNYNGIYEPYGRSRENLLSELRNNKNPFTESVIKNLRWELTDNPFVNFVPFDVLPYSEDFSTKSSAWPEFTTNVGQSIVQNGELQIIAKDYFFGGSPAIYKDFHLTFDANYEKQASDKYAYGIMLRMKDQNNFYVFFLTTDGMYSFTKRVSGQYVRVIEWTASSSIHTGGAKNQIDITCDEDHFVFKVNGTKLMEANDPAIPYGSIAFAVYRESADRYSQAGFDNLEIDPVIK